MRSLEQIKADMNAILAMPIKDMAQYSKLATEYVASYLDLEQRSKNTLLDQIKHRYNTSYESWHAIDQQLEMALHHIPNWMTSLVEQIEMAQEWIAQNTDAEEEALAAFRLYSREEDEFNSLRERLRGE